MIRHRLGTTIIESSLLLSVQFALAVSADVYIWAAAETNKESAFWKEVLLAAPQLPGEVGERLKGLPHNNDSLRTLKRIVDMAELVRIHSSYLPRIVASKGLCAVA